MIPENRIPTHPGVILSQEFLAPLGITQVAFAKHHLQAAHDLARSRPAESIGPVVAVG